MGIETVIILNTTAILVNGVVLMLVGNNTMNIAKDLKDNATRY